MYICSLLGVYGSAKDHTQVVKRLFIVGGKILSWLGKALLQSIFDCIEVPTYHKGSS